MWFLSNSALADVGTVDIPNCPQTVEIAAGKIVGAKGWDYSDSHRFLDGASGKIMLNDMVLTSDYVFPEITEINTYTDSVTGWLSSNDEEITGFSESYTWDIQEINESSVAVFYCNLVGDRNETPFLMFCCIKKYLLLQKNARLVMS